MSLFKLSPELKRKGDVNTRGTDFYRHCEVVLEQRYYPQKPTINQIKKKK